MAKWITARHNVNRKENRRVNDPLTRRPTDPQTLRHTVAKRPRVAAKVVQRSSNKSFVFVKWKWKFHYSNIYQAIQGTILPLSPCPSLAVWQYIYIYRVIFKLKCRVLCHCSAAGSSLNSLNESQKQTSPSQIPDTLTTNKSRKEGEQERKSVKRERRERGYSNRDCDWDWVKLRLALVVVFSVLTWLNELMYWACEQQMGNKSQLTSYIYIYIFFRLTTLRMSATCREAAAAIMLLLLL